MKVIVTCRDDWSPEMAADFGASGSSVDVPDDTETFLREVAERHGRFYVEEKNGLWKLEFQNDYD